jgi:hypothetical protein
LFPFGDAGAFDPSLFRDIDGSSWMSSLNEAGCAPGASLIDPAADTVGSIVSRGRANAGFSAFCSLLR